MSQQLDASHDGQLAGGVAQVAPGAAVFTHPGQVLRDRHLTQGQKRALLAAWASDARAVENAPALRRLDSGAVVGVDTVLQALQALDAAGAAPPKGPSGLTRRKGVRRAGCLPRVLLSTRSDDDDDPPPCPAAAALPLPGRFVAAIARPAAA